MTAERKKEGAAGVEWSSEWRRETDSILTQAEMMGDDTPSNWNLKSPRTNETGEGKIMQNTNNKLHLNI